MLQGLKKPPTLAMFPATTRQVTSASGEVVCGERRVEHDRPVRAVRPIVGREVELLGSELTRRVRNHELPRPGHRAVARIWEVAFCQGPPPWVRAPPNGEA